MEQDASAKKILDMVAAGDIAGVTEWVELHQREMYQEPITIGKDPLLPFLAKNSPPDCMVAIMQAVLAIAPDEIARGNGYLPLADRRLIEPILFLVERGVPFRGDEANWFAKLFEGEVSRSERRKVWDVLPDQVAVSRAFAKMFATSVISGTRPAAWEEMKGLAREKMEAVDILAASSAFLANIFALVLKDDPTLPVGEMHDLIVSGQRDGLIDGQMTLAGLKKAGYGKMAAEVEARMLSSAPPATARPSPNRL